MINTFKLLDLYPEILISSSFGITDEFREVRCGGCFVEMRFDISSEKEIDFIINEFIKSKLKWMNIFPPQVKLDIYDIKYAGFADIPLTVCSNLCIVVLAGDTDPLLNTFINECKELKITFTKLQRTIQVGNSSVLDKNTLKIFAKILNINESLLHSFTGINPIIVNSSEDFDNDALDTLITGYLALANSLLILEFLETIDAHKISLAGLLEKDIGKIIKKAAPIYRLIRIWQYVSRLLKNEFDITHAFGEIESFEKYALTGIQTWGEVGALELELRIPMKEYCKILSKLILQNSETINKLPDVISFAHIDLIAPITPRRQA